MYRCACVHAQLLQLCLTLCHSVACSMPGFSVHAILQARKSEWVLPNPWIEPASSPALAGGFFTSSATWEAT